jgi:hypothetical protein
MSDSDQFRTEQDVPHWRQAGTLPHPARYATGHSQPLQTRDSLLHGQAYGAAGLKETIWALKDVSFEVKHGEVVALSDAMAPARARCSYFFAHHRAYTGAR